MAPAAVLSALTGSDPEQLTAFLMDLTSSLTSTSTALSSTLLNTKSSTNEPENFPLLPPNGISLLDLKNELMLSYLHNIVFLVLVKLRGGALVGEKGGEGDGQVGSEVVRKLVELRVMLEKGVQPLETKLKYQIDKIVRAALEEETERRAAELPKKKGKKAKGDSDEDGEDDSEADSSASSDNDSRNDSDATSSDNLSIDGEPRRHLPKPHSTSLIPTTTTKEELSFRAGLPLLTKSTPASSSSKPSSSTAPEEATLYRPPKINPTSMPSLPLTSQTTDSNTNPRSSRRPPPRNAALDEFIASELSTAPIAEPSIGTTILAHGRSKKTTRERAEEAERREYEENNFVRLPKVSKKEMREKKKRGGGVAQENFGGEDWRSFAGDLDRLTRGVGGDGGGEGRSRGKSVLEASRKRKETEDGPVGSGMGEDGGRMSRIGGKYQRSVKRSRR